MSALGALNQEGEVGRRASDELMEAVDNYVPLPERAVDKPFLMPIEDIFSIQGRGTVVTGRVEQGIVKVGEEWRLWDSGRRRRRWSRAWRCSRSCWTRARRATTWDCCCGASDKDDVERGQVVAKPRSITPHTKFKGEVYVLSKEEGGRHTPFFKGYRPQFYFRTTDVTGVATLPEGTEMVMPGDNVTVTVELITPVAMDKGLRFAIREGGRTVGAGTVTEVVE